MPGIAHPDPHGDHEGRGTEELRKHLPLTCFRSAGLKIQDHMHYDHSEYTQRLQKVQLRLPPGIYFLIGKVPAHHVVSLKRIR